MGRESKLEKAIETMGWGTGRSFSDLFNDFLDLSLALLCNNPNDHQKKLVSATFASEKKKAAFLDALAAYGEAAENYHDPLGEMFMMRISHGQNGQFFTPDCICEFMAHIIDPIGESINDPTCGSGRLLLAGLKTSREKGMEPTIYGNDLSYTCAQMTLMNLLFNSAKGEVSCGNSLLMDLNNFRYFHIDRVMMPDGKWMSTYWQYTLANVDDVDRQRNEWRMKMLESGIPFEIIRPNVPKTIEIVPNEEETVQKIEEIVPKEPQYDHLTATPKAVQLELELF